MPCAPSSRRWPGMAGFLARSCCSRTRPRIRSWKWRGRRVAKAIRTWPEIGLGEVARNAFLPLARQHALVALEGFQRSLQYEMRLVGAHDGPGLGSRLPF